MQNKILIVAYHFPPIQASSGIQRTLKFATYLRDHGWESLILSANPRAYETTNLDQMSEIPDGMVVRRAFALDTARQLAIKGRYFRWLAIPDRYSTWLLGGVWQGLALIRQQRPRAIFTTYPIATAHLIGAVLHRITGLPWIADFRDSMTEDNYPTDPMVWRAYRRIERYAVSHATHCVFTTQGTRAMYAARYPDVSPDHWVVIPNGFDEGNFAEAGELAANMKSNVRKFRLLHSGTLYPSERDPTQLFEAIRRLKQSAAIDSNGLHVVLRATGHDDLFQNTLADLGIKDIVTIERNLPYREALTEMLAADGLLLLQAANCNHQVPAKLYEYLRAGRPILALTDPAGDTARELRSAKVGTIVPLDNANAIEKALPQFVLDVQAGLETGATPEQAQRYSRARGAETLAQMLNTLGLAS